MNTSAATRRKFRPKLDRAIDDRDTARRVLAQLDDPTLERFWRLGQMRYADDGFPASTLGDGTGHGEASLTSVEAAASNRMLTRRQHDLMGCWLNLLWADIHSMYKLAEKIDGLAKLIVSIKPVGRERLTPPCEVCGEDALPRPRSGMCEKHYRRWLRAGKPEKVYDAGTGRIRFTNDDNDNDNEGDGEVA